jgi:light-regulated signal transduction histidine kinase (bacteriophytochrome)
MELLEKNALLAKTNTNLEQFAYIASHDMQEPLRKITAYIDLFRMKYTDKLDDEAGKLINVISDGAARMSGLIKDLLIYSRINSTPAALTPVDLNQILVGVQNDLELIIAEKKAEIVGRDLPVVNANPIHMHRLFQNLISNALKFNGSDKPRVEISAKRQGEDWVVSISDNGIGIEKNDIQRIFQIFQRLHDRHRYPGSGIGLAVCAKIVEQHGGKIWAESTPGAGSTFFFSLPVSKPQAPADKIPEANFST